ncbi:MAG: FeoA family protein [Tissierellia bacterium]|nr:FeoA family protein [Tissierellia bacterium]
MPLTFAPLNVEHKIVEIKGRDKTISHLESMGFVKDAVVTVISELSGNLIIKLHEGRIALDKGLASKIIVGD